MNSTPLVILGSASPRRAELLAQLGLAFSQRAADIDETPRAGEPPPDYVQRMAREKAAALAADAGAALLLTADTTVVLAERSLGKPATATEARRMLKALSGATHEVYTAVCLRQAARSEELMVSTRVEFAVLSDALIDDYLGSEEPWDKAGGYAIQGLGGSFVRGVAGSVSNVIGLPLVETRELFARFGVALSVRRGGA